MSSATSTWFARATSSPTTSALACRTKDATEWFGKAPPDLSLVARSRGSDWVFNFLTTFYADPANRQTGVNNLQLPGTAMPHVLASVQGVQNAVWRNVESQGEGGSGATRAFEKFEPGVVGSMTPAQYDEFVRDTVNFLQYAGDPTQLEREGLGLWVVLSFSCSRVSRTC